MVLGVWGLAGAQLEVLMDGAQVHPLGLSEHQEAAQPQAADGGHQVEQGRPRAGGLYQVATQAHAHNTCIRERGQVVTEAVWGEGLAWSAWTRGQPQSWRDRDLTDQPGLHLLPCPSAPSTGHRQQEGPG